MPNYPQQYLGVELCNIPSGMGGVLPAAKVGHVHEGKEQVICLHSEYYPNWVLTVNQNEITPNTHNLNDFMKATIKQRKGVK